MSALPFPIPDGVEAAHGELLVTCAPGMGWWAECECGWIGPGYWSANAAHLSHRQHQRLRIGTVRS